MPWFADFLTSISRNGKRSRQPVGRRILAATLSAMLALGTVSPAAALASEAESEGEGTAPPGAIEGGPGGGEETVLEEVPGSVAGGGSEESGEGPPVEAEPEHESELPAPPAAEEVSGAVAEALPEVTQPPTSEAPSATESGPAYESAPAPPVSAPVENQPLSAPPSTVSESEVPQEPKAGKVSSEPSPSPEPAAPSEEEPPATQPPAISAERHGSHASLAGQDFHTVQSGECLWSIAAALLPAGASNGEVAAEVQRLWRLNASRIGTGDPSLLMVGTRLRLP
jgi:hypothetical protein